MWSLAAATGLAVLAAGCGAPRQLTRDTALSITAPRPFSTVSAPVEVRWRTTRSLPAGARFAVFVDALPMHPGASFRSLVPDGDPCLSVRSCPDASWLRSHGIIVTSAHAVRLVDLPQIGGLETRSPAPVHDVVVVLVDRDGRRIGEHAYSVEFRAAGGPTVGA